MVPYNSKKRVLDPRITGVFRGVADWITKPFHRDAIRDVAAVTAGTAVIAAPFAATGVGVIVASAGAGGLAAYARCGGCHFGPKSPGYYASSMGYC